MSKNKDNLKTIKLVLWCCQDTAKQNNDNNPLVQIDIALGCVKDLEEVLNESRTSI